MASAAEIRKSISHLHLYAAGPGVTPNASTDAEWRQEAGYGYAGIAATTVVAATWTLVSYPAQVYKTFTVRAQVFKTFSVQAIVKKTQTVRASLRRRE